VRRLQASRHHAGRRHQERGVRWSAVAPRAGGFAARSRQLRREDAGPRLSLLRDQDPDRLRCRGGLPEVRVRCDHAAERRRGRSGPGVARVAPGADDPRRGFGERAAASGPGGADCFSVRTAAGSASRRAAGCGSGGNIRDGGSTCPAAVAAYRYARVRRCRAQGGSAGGYRFSTLRLLLLSRLSSRRSLSPSLSRRRSRPISTRRSTTFWVDEITGSFGSPFSSLQS
jgi:hypothetical protein